MRLDIPHPAHARWRPLRQAALIALSLGSAGVTQASLFTQGFDAGVPAGWSVRNTGYWLNANNEKTWGPSDVGGALAANYESCLSLSTAQPNCTVSNWLITPTWTFSNGDKIAFYTTTVASDFIDRLQLRLGTTNDANIDWTRDLDVASDVGPFNSLLLDINPEQRAHVYPETWTRYEVTISGLDNGPTLGAIAFRHHVTSDVQSNIVYLAGFSFDGAHAPATPATPATPSVPEPGSLLLVAMAGLALVGARRGRQAAGV